MGAPGLDFQTWETSEPGVGENEKPLVEVHRLPHLKIEMWATQRYRSDMGHPRRHAALGVLAVNSIPRAFITASVVLSVGLPFSLNDR
jgi:hypothetical protein